MLKKILLSTLVMGQMAHATSSLSLEDKPREQFHNSLRKIDWESATIEDMERVVAHKLLKYKSIAENHEIDTSARAIYCDAFKCLNNTKWRFGMERLRIGFMKKASTEKRKYMEDWLININEAKPFWKSHYQNIVSSATPINPDGHRTLVVGCGHALDLQKDERGIDGLSDHRHLGAYTVNNDREECNPDCVSEIQNLAVLMKVFKNHRFDTIYFEHITTPPLSDDRTYATALHFLKPGGTLVFDAYFSRSFSKFSFSKPLENFSSIHLFNANVYENERTFRLYLLSTQEKMGSSKTPDLTPHLLSIDGIEKYEPRETDWFDFKSSGQFYNRTLNQITLKEGLGLEKSGKVLAAVSTLLVKLYLEQAGFVNPSVEIKPNPWNNRLNSQLFSAQKPL